MILALLTITNGTVKETCICPRKSPTGPTERTPKPEYRIARSQLA